MAGQSLWQVATASYLNFVVANGIVVLPDYVPHGTPPQSIVDGAVSSS